MTGSGRAVSYRRQSGATRYELGDHQTRQSVGEDAGCGANIALCLSTVLFPALNACWLSPRSSQWRVGSS